VNGYAPGFRADMLKQARWPAPIPVLELRRALAATGAG
jgi:hypothetical protein